MDCTATSQMHKVDKMYPISPLHMTIQGDIGAMLLLAKKLFWPHALADTTQPQGGWGVFNKTSH